MILIIEPHVDDVLFSCPEILAPGMYDAITIATFHNDGIRSNQIYQEHFGNHIRAYTFPVMEIGAGYAGSFHNDRQSWSSVIDTINDQLIFHFGNIGLMILRAETVLVPFGIKHPHHIVISNFFRNALRKMALPHWFYLERPYFDYVEDKTLYAAPMSENVKIVKTPNINRHQLMHDLIPAQCHVGGMTSVKDSRYIQEVL